MSINRWWMPTTAAAVCLAGGILAAKTGIAQDAGQPPALPAAASPAQVATAIEVSADEIKLNRKTMVSRWLDLSDAEAKDFWPVYDSFQKDTSVARKRNMDVVYEFATNYPTMTDDQAKKVLTDYLNNEKNLLDRKRTYVGRFNAVLPAKKVLRLYQLEDRMDASSTYNLAGKLPLIPVAGPNGGTK